MMMRTIMKGAIIMMLFLALRTVAEILVPSNGTMIFLIGWIGGILSQVVLDVAKRMEVLS